MNDGRIMLDDKTIARIADVAEASERSVWKRLAGGRVRGRVQGRIDRAIASVLTGGWMKSGGAGEVAAPREPKPVA
jgi:hypothetical protein